MEVHTMHTEQPMRAMVQVRLTQHEKQALFDRARADGRTVSEMVRDLARSPADQRPAA